MALPSDSDEEEMCIYKFGRGIFWISSKKMIDDLDTISQKLSQVSVSKHNGL